MMFFFKKPPPVFSNKMMEEKSHLVLLGAMDITYLWIPPRLTFNSFHLKPPRLGCQVETRWTEKNGLTTKDNVRTIRNDIKQIWLLKVGRIMFLFCIFCWCCDFLIFDWGCCRGSINRLMFGDPNWTQLLHICFVLYSGCLQQNVSRFTYIGAVVKSLRLIDIMVKVLQHSCLLHLIYYTYIYIFV